jgi:SAM-dependent methyltransferase
VTKLLDPQSLSVAGPFQLWKIRPIVKGTLTWIPILNAWRLRRGSTGGSDSARYCYSVWLRHLTVLDLYGFKVGGSQIGELGPGDSIGIGLAALLSGAAKYVGLDIVPFSARSDLQRVFNELVGMYLKKSPIPDHSEFPGVRPRLCSYEFPERLVEWRDFEKRAEEIRSEIETRLNRGELVTYRAPWTSPNDIALESLDLVFSQAVLEHVDDLENTYRAMCSWLKHGGYASHVIDFSAHHLSPFWNGHWAFTDREWSLVRGRREFLLNRYPLTAHLECARATGFETLYLHKDYGEGGLRPCALTKKFQMLDIEDLRTRGVVLVLRKH